MGNMTNKRKLGHETNKLIHTAGIVLTSVYTPDIPAVGYSSFFKMKSECSVESTYTFCKISLGKTLILLPVSSDNLISRMNNIKKDNFNSIMLKLILVTIMETPKERP